MNTRILMATLVALTVAGPGRSQPPCTHNEIEPNDDKSQAQAVTLNTGESVCGVLDLFAVPDYWRIRTGSASPAVYRHVLDAGLVPFSIMSVAIRGLQQTNGTIVPGTDEVLQINPGQNQHLAWYGFGQGEEIYVRFVGTIDLPYDGILTTTQVAPTVIGPFVRGNSSVEFRTIPTTEDTELWLYRVDAQGNITPVVDAGNDEASSGGPGSRMSRFLPLGRYLLAVGLANMANNLRSPSDDGNRNGDVLDFPGGIASSSPPPSPTPHTIPLHVQDADGTHTFNGTISDFAEILWYQFDLVERISFTIPSGLEGTPGNVGTTVPFALTSNFRGQYAYDSSEFPQVPMTITDLSVRMQSPALADPTGLNLAELNVVLGTAVDLSALGSNFQNNYFQSLSQTMRSGAYSSGAIPTATGATGEWISLGLTGTYDYSPCTGRDLIIEMQKCGVISALSGSNDAHNTTLARRVGAVGSSPTFCSSLPPTGSVSAPGQSFALVVRVDAYTTVVPADVPYQVNSPEANVNFDGQQTDGWFGIEVGYCAAGPAAGLNIESTLTGTPWDLAISQSPLVTFNPCSSLPLQRTPEGQVVNLDLAQPLVFLNGLTLPAFPGNLNVSVSAAGGFQAGIQGIFLDPAHADGVRLSAASGIAFGATQTLPGAIPGPTQDNSNVTVPVGCVQVYERTYNEMHVSSNGRIVFGAPDVDGSPSIPEGLSDNPWVGAWVDLDPSLGGAINITSPAQDVFRVNYQNVPYKNAPQFAATFFIELNVSSGRMTIGGLQGIQAAPGVDMLLGTSMGQGRAAICGTGPGGQTPFAVAGPTRPACPNEMLHRFGSTGTLAPGVGVLRFDAVLVDDPFSPIVAAALVLPRIWNFQWTGQ
jgi:hypothetical protein